MMFRFVNNGGIDGDTRKIIRSHVMKGKNAGKTHRRRKQRGAAMDVDVSTSFPLSTSSSVISLPRMPGHSFSFFPFPVDEQPYMREHIFKCKLTLHLKAR
jgi:hypothetical protein